MTFAMGLLVALARRILRDELGFLTNEVQTQIESKAGIAEELQNSRRSGAALANENEKLMARLQLLTHENTELQQELEVKNNLVLSLKEAKRASEKREEDQRAINLELKLRLKKIRELLG